MICVGIDVAKDKHDCFKCIYFQTGFEYFNGGCNLQPPF